MSSTLFYEAKPTSPARSNRLLTDPRQPHIDQLKMRLFDQDGQLVEQYDYKRSASCPEMDEYAPIKCWAITLDMLDENKREKAAVEKFLQLTEKACRNVTYSREKSYRTVFIADSRYGLVKHIKYSDCLEEKLRHGMSYNLFEEYNKYLMI